MHQGHLLRMRAGLSAAKRDNLSEGDMLLLEADSGGTDLSGQEWSAMLCCH